ncbi:MAG: DUF4393 domain-containing protein [Okeania sp. SIO3B5]|uniref:Abi-alpha family protein n=1 Tax=Okeania sp. SIO3B5 TaxID=2607811 RepID=UPI001400AFF2|nr:Abi-alpha family protein [Okeania sp. SIO3B5]NEO52502.1 DUF4393 domain-containing protein [Okeania sp. SIO3B5]
MPEETTGLDLVGIGKLAQAIPDTVWKKLVDTACDTFSKTISPLTATTSGLGRLIEAKFDGMVEAQKVYAADTIQRAQKKIDQTKNTDTGTNKRVKSVVLIDAIEKSSIETDEGFREIWANLIANEFLGGQVHPEFPRVLERLSYEDAVVFLEIAEKNQKDKIKRAIKSITVSLLLGIGTISLSLREETDFHREHLKNLHLVRSSESNWSLTLFGEEFLKAVTDPSFSLEE